VSFSFRCSLTVCRRRSSPGDTLSRACVRHVADVITFPSALTLRFIGSAVAPSTLFADFDATIAESESSRPYIIGYDSSSSRCGPMPAYGRLRGLPVPAQGVCTHARFSDHAGPRPRTCDSARERVAFRHRNSVGTLDMTIAAQWLAYVPLPTLHVCPREQPRTA
jgi:hypothetical protein